MIDGANTASRQQAAVLTGVITKISFKCTALAVAFLASAAPAFTVHQYRIIDLGLAPGTKSTVARAISENGAIAGESGSQGGNADYRIDGGIVPLLTLLGGTNFVSRGIIYSGVVTATVGKLRACTAKPATAFRA